LHLGSVAAPRDPTVRPSRLLPESLESAARWGRDAAGGERATVVGLRVLAFPSGAMVAAPDRLPSAPTAVVTVPDRMGGGFLLAQGTQLWRASSWLAAASPVFASSTQIAQVLVGLDRVYVRGSRGGLTAIDPRSGTVLDLGSVPPTPTLTRIAALDAWRAIALADLRGGLVTLDAGSTWRPLTLPFAPGEVVPLANSFLVTGADENHRTTACEVHMHGSVVDTQVLPEGSASAAAPPAPRSEPVAPRAPEGGPSRTFGSHPIVAAVEDGWPLSDGTVLVARDGALGRVRLSDGALLEVATSAFPLRPARCHPLALPRPQDPGGFGFVCGEPRGRTMLYRWDVPTAQLIELRRFDAPRAVLSFGNGALAVHGGCAAAAGEEAAESSPTYCIMRPNGNWEEVHLRGEDARTSRLVVLSDGRLAVLRPPRAGNVSGARLTIVDGAHTWQGPLSFPSRRDDAVGALQGGLWLDGFEERRPGVLGGWIDGAGFALGVEVSADQAAATAGEVRVGEVIRDAGAPIVGGRWGFGWTASRRGFETTDGGMTWARAIDLPEPIALPAKVHERACGPVGCIAAGWVRVGWGPSAVETAPSPSPRRPLDAHVPSALELDCHVRSPGAHTAAADAGGRSLPGRGELPALASIWDAAPWSGHAHRTTQPPLPADVVEVSAEATGSLERSVRPIPMARISAWGPKIGEWRGTGHWEVGWAWPWGGSLDARRSSIAPASWESEEQARRVLGIGPVAPIAWALSAGDDPDHALLLGRQSLGGGATYPVVLEADRAPTEVRPPRGDAFAPAEGAIRAGGHWYLATTQSAGELPATVVWRIEGHGAREIARIPRAGFELRPPTRLARRSDRAGPRSLGLGLGLVVDGLPDADRRTMRWVVSIDPETGAVGDPEPLAAGDFSDRTVSLCAGDEGGWTVDLPYTSQVRARVGPGGPTLLTLMLARLRLTRERACIEHALAWADAWPATIDAPDARSGSPTGSDGVSVDAILAGRTRVDLRCIQR
jgi:hypothetical protein